MKKQLIALKTCLLIILLSACTEDDTIESNADNFVNNISLNKQNAFTDEEIKLTFDAINYDSIKVSSEVASININTISETSYTLTSNQKSSSYINITTYSDTINKVEQVLVNFHEHGTTDYQTIEGINIANSNIYNLLLLHGEPDGVTTETIETTTTDPDTEETTTVVNVYEYWHYLSKGFSYRSFRHTGNVLSVTIYGQEWEATLDNNTTVTGNKYPYEIIDLGNFNDGILMDTVVNQFGAEYDSAINNESDETKAYIYNDVNTGLTGNQKGSFYFTSTDEIDNYTGKSVEKIIISY